MTQITNAALAERIAGLGELLAAKIDAVDGKVEALNVKVAVQNGRVGKLEAANLVAITARDTARQVADIDRQHNRDAEQASWTHWQKLLGAGGVVCASLAGAGGMVELLTRFHF